MGKELPYFRFTVSEWISGDISLESYEMKGLFADICSYYWFKDCSMTQAMLYKRFSNAETLLSELIRLKIIKTFDNSEFIEISFLNEQFDILSESRKRRQDAGSKGGKKRSSNAKAKLKQCSSYKDKDKDKELDKVKDKEEVPFEKFWNLYDKKEDRIKCEGKWNRLTNKERENCITNLPAYIVSTPDKQFRKNPATYLNNKSWENEIISNNLKQNDDLEFKQLKEKLYGKQPV